VLTECVMLRDQLRVPVNFVSTKSSKFLDEILKVNYPYTGLARP